MKIYYDEKMDAAYIKLSEEKPSGVVEMSEGVNLDMTEDGKIVGIEILDAARKIPIRSLLALMFQRHWVISLSFRPSMKQMGAPWQWGMMRLSKLNKCWRLKKEFFAVQKVQQPLVQLSN